MISKEIHRINIYMGEYLFDWDEIRLPSIVIENSRALYTLTEALIYQANKEFDKAEKKLKSIPGIINNQDTLAIKYHFLGNLYLSQIRDLALKDVNRDSLLRLSEEEYRKSIEKDSTYHNSYFGLGYLLTEKKRDLI